MGGSSYLPVTTPEEEAILGGMPAIGGIFLIVIFAFLFVMLAFAVVSLIFQGIGIMKMHEKLGLKGGWLAFIPILNSFAMGRVAEQYIKENGKKSAKFSIILLVCQIVSFFFAFAMGVILGIGTAFLPASIYAIINLVFTLLAYGLSFIASVIAYIALWRVFAIFSNKNATLYLILSIFVSVVQPFLIFAIRNKEPLCVEVKTEEIPEAAQVIE